MRDGRLPLSQVSEDIGEIDWSQYRQIVSRNGRISIISEKAMKEDLVCVLLFGCSVLVLLWRFEHEDKFTFIRECFLDGYRDGLILEQCELLERTFCI